MFTQKRPLQISVRTLACHGTPNAIHFLEQVEVIVSLSHTKRGAVRIFTTSPTGTKTLMAPKRDMDSSMEGLKEWSFVSVHNWAENPLGRWLVNFESHVSGSQVHLFLPAFVSLARFRQILLSFVFVQVNESLGGGSLHSLRLLFHG